jgi:hypothetical protein
VVDGQSVPYAALAIGKPETSVRRALLRFRETQRYTRRPDSGRPRSTSARDDKFLTLQCLRDRHQAAVELAQSHRGVRGTVVSAQIVRQRLVAISLNVYRPNRVPRLTRQHKQRKL